jgi:hypothetical protein
MSIDLRVPTTCWEYHKPTHRGWILFESAEEESSIALLLPQSFYRIDQAGAASWNKAGQERSQD